MPVHAWTSTATLRKTALFALGSASIMMTGRVAAQAPNTQLVPVSTIPADAVPGWDAMVQGVRDLPAQILSRLPEAQRNDPQVRAEVGRLALSALAAASIDALAGDPDHPVSVPQLNSYLTIGQPNADTGYRLVDIAPGGTFRLRGLRGSMRMSRVAEVGPRPPQTGPVVNLGPPRPVHDLNMLKVDKDGHYDVILSPERPAGYTGDWWQSSPTSNRLLIRMVGSDWVHEVQPTFSVERVDGPVTRPRPSAAVLEAKLRAMPAAMAGSGPQLVGAPAKLRAEGFVNKLKAADFSQQGGLKGQFYFEGAYELKDDEALVLEAKVPDRCLYSSVILTNDLYETTDWYNNESSLNDAQAKPDKDGVLRIVIAAKDPGARNWLDTAGYPTGVIQGRWTECSSQPVPVLRKVAFADLRKELPAGTAMVTPQERDRILRDRRTALQLRSLW